MKIQRILPSKQKTPKVLARRHQWSLTREVSHSHSLKRKKRKVILRLKQTKEIRLLIRSLVRKKGKQRNRKIRKRKVQNISVMKKKNQNLRFPNQVEVQMSIQNLN